MKRFSFIALALCLFAAASITFGQTVNSRVTGTVKDTADAVVPGVKVTLIDAKTRDEKTAPTKEEEDSPFVKVPMATNTVTADLANSIKRQSSEVKVNATV